MLFQWIPIYPVQIVENINDLLQFLVVGDGGTKSDIQFGFFDWSALK